MTAIETVEALTMTSNMLRREAERFGDHNDILSLMLLDQAERLELIELLRKSEGRAQAGAERRAR